ncbi:hypothetical protein K437DRAFT_8890 [Tilletiaria anomala UBC 951]|uniref:Uncharacterized protein n=1 Tax=Tilletiaria anomala (strain ATCC 24038 / CBS 436.72 / UBC 951) TaxID=1037660 RepID=A0A066VD58_TILAU|nr:uncharacterized protein K437DRAFT_8890 [Tilletiaria anomala UBC 951]KDN39687.1 hypothetical protein K437DRAFT_8890 [Tilletiaria anomala UBC 951]
MDEDIEEKKLVSFEQSTLFLAKLQEFICLTTPALATASGIPVTVVSPGSAFDWDQTKDKLNTTHGEEELFAELANILDEYQEQSYLLDPVLDRMVAPIATALRWHIQDCYAQTGKERSRNAGDEDGYGLEWLSKLMYLYTKVRGHKIITHFFPHEVDDLLPVLALLEASQEASLLERRNQKYSWQVRYTLLLWLSLVCMIPFDLKNFDITATGSKAHREPTADRIATIAKGFLSSSGKERDAGIMVLGKLFQRKDAAAQLDAYLPWCEQSLQTAKHDTSFPFLSTGILFSLCELLKVLNPDRAKEILPQLQSLLDTVNTQVEAGGELKKNSLVGKGRTKLSARIALKLLKPRSARSLARPGVRAKPLMAEEFAANSDADAEFDDGLDADVPEEVDGYIGELIESLSHQDTMVRYSAAKGLARVCTRLPPSMVPQVTEAIVSLFPSNVIQLPDGSIDLSAASEHTWQGACLALAELARRGMLSTDSASSYIPAAAQYELDEQLMWVQRALFFDPRRGAHSVGSGVRDAACYVIWALARANDEKSIRPHADSLAANLVCVACTDREVSIRRAASAAFQECAGRLNIFPHGLEVIRKADFFAVGVRKQSFLDVLPAIAEHVIYREALLRQLQRVSLAHWDISVREAAAQAICSVVRHDLDNLLMPTVDALLQPSKDQPLAHGRLLALAALGASFGTNDPNDACGRRAKILECCHTVANTLRSSGISQHLLEASCIAVAANFEGSIVAHKAKLPDLEDILETALASPNGSTHESASQVVKAIASTYPSWDVFESVRRRWKSLSANQQQGWSLALGSIKPLHGSSSVEEIARFLVNIVTPGKEQYSNIIEARRNSCISVARLLQHQSCSKDTILVICTALIGCLEDYTVDQRGDVGSWVRTAAMQSLASIVEGCEARAQTGYALLDVQRSLLKQTAERIDSVRSCAAKSLHRTAQATPMIPRDRHMKALLSALDEATELNLRDASWLFTRLVSLLDDNRYRRSLLEGFLNSIGSKADVTRQSVASALHPWLLDSPIPRASLILVELHKLLEANFSSNKIFVPVIEACNILFDTVLETSTWEQLSSLLQPMYKLAFRSVDKIKSLPRLQACVVLCVNMLTNVPSLRRRMVTHICAFLRHPFPTLRQNASERLYMILADFLPVEASESSLEDASIAMAEAEELLLNTPWVSQSRTYHAEAARRLEQALLRTVGLNNVSS